MYLGRGLGGLALGRKENSVDVGENTTLQDQTAVCYDSVELSIVTKAQTNVPGSDALALAITRDVTSKLEDLCYEVLNASGQEDGSIDTDTLAAIELVLELLLCARDREDQARTDRAECAFTLTSNLGRSRRVLVLGYSLVTFADSMLGEFTREEDTDGSLEGSGVHGLTLGVHQELVHAHREAANKLLNEAIDDLSGIAVDPSVGVNLLEYLASEASIALVVGTTLLGTRGCFG